MFRNKSVDSHQFAMVPGSEIPRSRFDMQKGYKTAFSSGYLIPVYCEEVLPGDTFNLRMTAFCRMATPIYPIMDNLYLESQFFFIPNRLLWTNWKRFMGEQDNPSDSTSYTVPVMTSPNGGYAIGSLHDYFGLPTVGQMGGAANISHVSLPLRAYNLVWNQWYRDENLQNSVTIDVGDGPDTYTNYVLKRRGKRHDYFTAALPWTQKGTSVPLPLTGNATVKTAATDLVTGAQNPLRLLQSLAGAAINNNVMVGNAGANIGTNATAGGALAGSALYPSNLQADLSTATAVTVNVLRQSFQIQKLLERDARGGTRYTELVRSHFGVVSPDARLQRPEYLGGGRTMVNISPVAQTSATGVTGGSTPAGQLAAFGTALAQDHGFTQSFTEHGYVLGLISVRADLTYQQGMRRHWSRSTKYDYYWPVFAMLGEQAILNKEIYARGDANDALVFGYQERWAEYRYTPSEITGIMRSTAASTLDAWHLSQKFTSLPTLNATFIEETPPVSRVIAVPSQPEFIADIVFVNKAARPLPLYSVPGMIDHF